MWLLWLTFPITLALVTLEAGISKTGTNRWSWLIFSIYFKLTVWKWSFLFLFLSQENESGQHKGARIDGEQAPSGHVTSTLPDVFFPLTSFSYRFFHSHACCLLNLLLTRFDNCLLSKLHEFDYQLFCAVVYGCWIQTWAEWFWAGHSL